MFYGSYEHTIDTKGRLSIPAKFRDNLIQKYESKNITLIIQGKCLVAYPQREWENLINITLSLNPFDLKVQHFQRRFFHKANEVEVDGQGRVLVPSSLRIQAGLDKEVLIIGSTNKFEIWDRVRWTEYLSSKRVNQDEDWALAAQVFTPPQA